MILSTRKLGRQNLQVSAISLGCMGMSQSYGQADEAEWDSLKDIFLKKNPFKAPFFGNPALRMVRVRPKRISYTGPDMKGFKTEP